MHYIFSLSVFTEYIIVYRHIVSRSSSGRRHPAGPEGTSAWCHFALTDITVYENYVPVLIRFTCCNILLWVSVQAHFIILLTQLAEGHLTDVGTMTLYVLGYVYPVHMWMFSLTLYDVDVLYSGPV